MMLNLFSKFISFNFFLLDFFKASSFFDSSPSNNLTIAVLLNIFFLPEKALLIFFFEFSEFTNSKIGVNISSQISSYFFRETRVKNKEPKPKVSYIFS